ncbi:MAG: hypothetical protein WC842_00990 [Candidatus Paceibacterota bacterium]|jgi:hypothetical protein
MNVDKLIQEISGLVGKVLDVEHIKKEGRTGVFIHISDKNTKGLIVAQAFGVLTPEKYKKYSLFANKKAYWLNNNPNALSTVESNGDVPGGGVSGENYIVTVSGLNPKDDSALAILILSLLEKEERCIFRRIQCVEKAGCRNEINAFIFHIVNKAFAGLKEPRT